MSYLPVTSESFELARMNDYRRFVEQLGSEIDFNSEKWVCDKRIRSTAELKCDVTLYFRPIPNKFKEMVKYYCALILINGNGIATVASKLINLTSFFRFLEEHRPDTETFNISIHTASDYRIWLDNKGLTESTKAMKWRTLNMFCRTMRDWSNSMNINPFSENPYRYNLRRSYKYIPESIITQLDSAFRDEGLLVHIRCTYWILRLIPSRINEILAMKIDCLKPYDGHFCLFIPTWKQNGGYFDPVMRVIHIENIGVAAELIALIRQQQTIATSLQDDVEESLQGSLFTYRITYECDNGKRKLGKQVRVVREQHISRHFGYICKRNNIYDEYGKVFAFASHQLRHNGITDRLAAGFTPEQIRFMTSHHGDAMIYKAYNHLDLLPEVIMEKQQYVLDEPSGTSETKVLFGGRILNMEEQLEKRLLKNIRAQRVPGGICSDITGCKSDMFFCLSCDSFIPDAGQLDYYIEQVGSWKQKAERFKDFPLIKNNAEKNARFFRVIVDKITKVRGESHNE